MHTKWDKLYPAKRIAVFNITYQIKQAAATQIYGQIH